MLKNNTILLLKISKGRLFFNPQEFLSAEKIAIELSVVEDIEYFKDKFHFLKVKVLNFDSGILRCKIIDFRPYETKYFNTQIFDSSNIKKLLLSSGDTDKILNLAKRKISKDSYEIDGEIINVERFVYCPDPSKFASVWYGEGSLTKNAD